jgi:hypothetical protein
LLIVPILKLIKFFLCLVLLPSRKCSTFIFFLSQYVNELFFLTDCGE